VVAHLEALKLRLREIHDLYGAAALLSWDQTTMMPVGGAEARGRQLALLSRLAHERLTDPALGGLLDDAATAVNGDAALLQVARRDYERATCVPTELVAEIAEHTTASYSAWVAARPNNDWATMRPLLERTVELSKRYAECFPGYEHIADPLIAASDYGMRASEVRSIFNALRKELVPLVASVTAKPVPDDSFLRRQFPLEQQRAFGEEIARRIGYSFERGRQDVSAHPFMTKFSIGDVRITTRYNEHDLLDGLFSTVHEVGHALYEQGIDPAFEGTPLNRGTSAGVHESQSRLWENIVGRSRPFWAHFYPLLQQYFPTQLSDVSLDAFYPAINTVRRSLIRVDADELTYNLHVMLRFELEMQLLEGSLQVADLPAAWNASYTSDLGITPPDDRDGVLQDVHWYGGLVGGAFQGYTLGNILSAQFYDAAVQAHPGIPDEIGRGEFATLYGWLRENIYRHGASYTAAELVERTTNSPLRIEPYLAYLRGKYGPLYNV
jgi:carboxypeptidase Taq